MIVSVALDFDCTYIPQSVGTDPSTLATPKLQIVGFTDDGTERVKVHVFEPTFVDPL